LLLDDADTLDDDTLLATWLLRDVTDNGRSLLSLVLCGTPALNARLTAPVYSPLVQRLSLSYALEPLSLRQLREFVPGAMATLQLQPPLPEAAELAQLHATTAGYPAAVIEALQQRIPPPPRPPRLAVEEPAIAPPRLRQVRQRSTKTTSLLLPVLAMLFGSLLLAVSAYGFWLDTQPVRNSGDSAVSSTLPASPAVPRTPLPATRPATIAIAPGAPLAPLVRAPLALPPLPDTPHAELPAQPQGYLPTQAELQRLIDSWLDAWQRGDQATYLGYYHTDFAPLYQATRELWRNQAVAMLAGPKPLDISRETLDITAIDRIGVHVQFWMEYRTAGNAERLLKELYVGRDLDGQVRLLQEFEREP
ncbi:MAG TPA: hypothetical protein VNR18_12825, partial [Hyphomicrobiales bacterium]|nr:hypothetical protein [Hyphomicrobiales bacterium]